MVNSFQYNDSDKKTRNSLYQNPEAFSKRKHKNGRARFLPKGSFTTIFKVALTGKDGYPDSEYTAYKRIKQTLEEQHGLMIKIIHSNTTTYLSSQYAEFVVQVYYGPINKLCYIYEQDIVVSGISKGVRPWVLRMIPYEL